MEALGDGEGDDESRVVERLAQLRLEERRLAAAAAPAPPPRAAPPAAAPAGRPPPPGAKSWPVDRRGVPAPHVMVPQSLLAGTRFCSYVKRGQKCPDAASGACAFAHDPEVARARQAACRRFIDAERAKLGWGAGPGGAAPVPVPAAPPPARAEGKGKAARQGAAAAAPAAAAPAPAAAAPAARSPTGAPPPAERAWASATSSSAAAPTAAPAAPPAGAAYAGGAAFGSAAAAAAAAAAAVGLAAGPSAAPAAWGAAAAAATAPAAGSLFAGAYELADDALLEALLCSSTQKALREPVVAADGFSYERSALEAWLAGRGTSPLTGLPLAGPDAALLPNHALQVISAASWSCSSKQKMP